MEKAEKKTITKKKVKIVGKQKYINQQTGQVEEMLVTTIEERDFNFTKVWMMSLLPQLKIIGNKKIDVCMWIIEHLNKDNQLIYTYRQIADNTGVSVETVKSTMQALMGCDFLRKQNIGCYIVNPDVIFKGTKSSREDALFVFRSISGSDTAPNSTTKEQQIKDLEANVANLQKKIRFLREGADIENTEETVGEARKLMKAGLSVKEAVSKAEDVMAVKRENAEKNIKA